MLKFQSTKLDKLIKKLNETNDLKVASLPRIIMLKTSMSKLALLLLFSAATAPAASNPVIHFAFPQSQRTFGAAYNDSLANLTVINTVGAPAYFRAGGDYNDSWTRDGSLNPWNAGTRLIWCWATVPTPRSDATEKTKSK